MTLLLVLLRSWLTLSALATPDCSELDPAGLRALTGAQPTTEVVFFASWCGECRAHVQEAGRKGRLLIATFDDRAAAASALAKLGVTAPCYLDRGVAAAYQVKAVPTVLLLDRSGKLMRQVAP